MDTVKEDMQIVGVRVEDTDNRVNGPKWRPLKKGKAVRKSKEQNR